MEWLVFSYSLPAKGPSSPRVALWRRLKRLGAVTPSGSIYLLPAREDSLEAFQWLAQEIRHAGGDALVLHVTHVDGLTDHALIDLFHAARQSDYDDVDRQVHVLEHALVAPRTPKQDAAFQETLAQLRRRHREIVQIDYFATPIGADLDARLARLAQTLTVSTPAEPLPAACLAEYRTVRWRTRPRPHVDRLACAWLIRRFINPDALIDYGPPHHPDAVTFDLPDADFGHHGDSCTFETMLQRFGLDDPALRILAEIVHDIDLRDGRFLHPEGVGVALVLQGWLLDDASDGEREARGIALFAGLYQGLLARTRHEQATGESSMTRSLPPVKS